MKRKQKLSHFSCKLRQYSFEILHYHYIQPNPTARRKTHERRYSLYVWQSGYKFFEWVIKPFRMNSKTSRIFDRTRFVINHNYKFKVGHLKQ